MWDPKPTFETIDHSPTYTKTFNAMGHSRFYQPTGLGRDDYIFKNNGGFCPSNDPWKIADKGEFLYQKQRYVDAMPVIHSKSLIYHPNGGGRDSYIFASSGGFTKQHSSGEFRNTFYNSLRQQDAVYSPK